MNKKERIKLKEYLRKPAVLNSLLEAKMYNLQTLRNTIYDIRAVELKEKIQNSKSGSNKVDMCIDLESEIEDNLKELSRLKFEVSEYINKLDCDKLKLVMYHRYINLMKFEDIAEKMNYSIHNIFKLHNRALYNLLDFERVE